MKCADETVATRCFLNAITVRLELRKNPLEDLHNNSCCTCTRRKVGRHYRRRGVDWYGTGRQRQSEHKSSLHIYHSSVVLCIRDACFEVLSPCSRSCSSTMIQTPSLGLTDRVAYCAWARSKCLAQRYSKQDATLSLGNSSSYLVSERTFTVTGNRIPLAGIIKSEQQFIFDSGLRSDTPNIALFVASIVE